LARQAKAAKVFPRPVAGLLRPVVTPPTQRYNFKVRKGRGFTPAELKKAGVPMKLARTIGIAVDKRRRNKNEVSLAANVERIKEYQSKLVVFPKSGKKAKQGDATKEQLANVAQNTHKDIIPIKRAKMTVTARKITEADRKVSVFETLRKRHIDRKLEPKRAKKRAAAEKASE
jgi:large subunit ribosomal protein L13e